MKILLRAWGAIAIASMLIYGFAGVGFWAPLSDHYGFARFMILFAFHVGGVFAIITYIDIKDAP